MIAFPNKPQRSKPTATGRTHAATTSNGKLNAFKLLHAAPDTWQKKIERLHAVPVSSTAAAFGLSRTLDTESALMRVIERAALLHAYIERRYNHVAGDPGHAKAAAAANRRLIRIRRALGFFSPQSLPVTFPTSEASAHGRRTAR